MRIAILGSWLFTAFSLLLLFTSTSCLAGEKEHVELLEKFARQHDDLNRAASNYAAVLEEVKDRTTADVVVGRYESAAEAFISAVETFVPTLEAVVKQGMRRFSSPEYKERAQSVMRRQPAITQEWVRQSQRYASETDRVDKLQGLSSRFWDAFSVQNVRVAISVGKVSTALGSLMPANVSKYLGDKLALYEKCNVSKVVDIGVEGGSTSDRTEIEQRIRKSFGTSVTVIALIGDQGEVITVAPVENLDDAVAKIGPANIKTRDEARHRIIIAIGASNDTVDGHTAPAMPAKASSPMALANGQADTTSGRSAKPTDDGATSTAASTPANSNLQREYARLAQLLHSDDTFGKREAVESLLKVRPSDVASVDTRKLIARGYKSVATSAIGPDKDKAIQGLVIWGGKYSVPILIDMLDKDKHGMSEELYDALAQLKDPQGAEAVARRLGNFFSHEHAVNALRKMGSVAEDALIKTAPSGNPDASLAAVQLLGEVGSDKSIAILQQATNSRNPRVKMAARESLRRIRDRKKTGESVDKSNAAADPNSPFAEGSGPPVDITARNSSNFTKNAVSDLHIPGIKNSRFADDPSEKPADLDEGDWSQANALLPGDPAGSGVPPDPLKDAPAAGWKPQPTRLSNPTSNHERSVSMTVSGGAAPLAVVAYEDPLNKSIARLETISLRQRKSVGSATVVGGVKQCYLSPTGTRVLLVAEEGFHNRKARLDVWSMNGGKPIEEVTWWPFATSKGLWGPNEITWADWLDDDQLLIVNGEGTAVLWRVEGKKAHAIYQIDAKGRCTPALSPGRTYMALATPRGVEIYRATNGEILARMEDVRPGAGQVAFSADGTKLACVSGTSVYLWNATTGKLERDFDCADLRSGDLIWLDDNHLFSGGTDIIDLERRIVLWRYETPPLPASSRGNVRWLVMQVNNVLGLVPLQLLQPEVLAAADELDPETILALKPGTAVSLDVQIGGDDQQKAEAALRQAVEQNGMTVVPDSPITITARIVTGQTETKEYGSGFFFRENREQVSVASKHYQVELMIDGQSAWKQMTTIQAGSPPVIWLKNGESAQQAIDRQNAERSAHFSFTAAIPRHIVHPKYAGPRGTSRISFGGGR